MRPLLFNAITAIDSSGKANKKVVSFSSVVLYNRLSLDTVLNKYGHSCLFILFICLLCLVVPWCAMMCDCTYSLLPLEGLFFKICCVAFLFFKLQSPDFLFSKHTPPGANTSCRRRCESSPQRKWWAFSLDRWHAHTQNHWSTPGL